MSETIEMIDRIPTDGEIIDIINSIKMELKFFENLLKLNEKGRKEALIYMCGLLHFQEYNYSAERKISRINKVQNTRKDEGDGTTERNRFSRSDSGD